MNERVPIVAVVVFAIGLMLIPAYVWMFAVRPHRLDKISALDQELYDVDVRLEQARAAQRKSVQFREEMERLGAEIEKHARILPADANDSPLPPGEGGRRPGEGRGESRIGSVTPLIRRSAASSSEGRRMYDIHARGTLKSLLAYLTNVESQERLVAFQRIELVPDGDVWRTNALVAVPYERGAAASSATTSSARTGRAK